MNSLKLLGFLARLEPRGKIPHEYPDQHQDDPEHEAFQGRIHSNSSHKRGSSKSITSAKASAGLRPAFHAEVPRGRPEYPRRPRPRPSRHCGFHVVEPDLTMAGTGSQRPQEDPPPQGRRFRQQSRCLKRYAIRALVRQRLIAPCRQLIEPFRVLARQPGRARNRRPRRTACRAIQLGQHDVANPIARVHRGRRSIRPRSTARRVP